MKNKKRQRSLLWRVARLNACTLFLSNVLLVLCLLSLFFFSTLRAEKQDLERMVTQLSERVVLVGTPSKASFADVTLRDGLSFALYAMDQTVLYVSSYGMPSTTVREFPPEVKIIGHTDYTTFAREGQTRDMIVHAASFVQTDEETVVLYVVSDISYLLTLLSVLPTLLLGYLLLSLLLSVLLGRFMSRRSLAPLCAISSQIASKTSATLFERIDASGTDKEFFDLITAFNSLMERLEQSFHRQRQFISDASHELRTPLAVMRGHISMLVRWGKDDREVLESSLAVLQKESLAVSEIVSDLLLLNRADRASLPVTRAIFSVRELLEEVRSDAALVAIGAIIQVDVAAALPYAGDRTLIKQVLRILMDNSLRYCPPPGVITLSARKLEQGVTFCVHDTGEGIPEEALPYIFDRFYRAHPGGDAKQGNSGLGLAIAKAVVEMMGGTISASSVEGQWTSLEFSLPDEPQV